jgi:tryptophan 2,3-dioxygenase
MSIKPLSANPSYRQKYFAMLDAPEILDYGTYLHCERLLDCQKPLEELCNADELQFQIVHQVEELWMKLMIYTLVDVLEYLRQENTHRIVTLMKRVHFLQKMMIEQLDVLETMSPKEYQQIRLQLGNGSGQESPGFRTLMLMPRDLWTEFSAHYLQGRGKSVENIYDSEYAHDDSYVVAEALIEFDELLQKFRSNHLFLIQRSIGLASKSLKGRPVELLQDGAKHRFFPELWDIRSAMTDTWGGEYGQVRDPITPACPFAKPADE